MRQTNIFRTTKRDHHIPREVMIKALRLSPGKDWTDHNTAAYDYLKNWALNEDVKRDGSSAERVMVSINEFDGVLVPKDIMDYARDLSPGNHPELDKRTKAYKYIKAWINGKTN